MGAQYLFQVAGVIVAQAQQQAAFDCESYPVAGGAEVVAVGGNETNANVRGFGQAPIA
ncbi:hypothetical protein D3C77_755240 [compost metagenome]